jgi:hypothetical protein
LKDVALEPTLHYLALGKISVTVKLRLVHGFEDEFEFEDD